MEVNTHSARPERLSFIHTLRGSNPSTGNTTEFFYVLPNSRKEEWMLRRAIAVLLPLAPFWVAFIWALGGHCTFIVGQLWVQPRKFAQVVPFGGGEYHFGRVFVWVTYLPADWLHRDFEAFFSVAWRMQRLHDKWNHDCRSPTSFTIHYSPINLTFDIAHFNNQRASLY